MFELCIVSMVTMYYRWQEQQGTAKRMAISSNEKQPEGDSALPPERVWVLEQD